MNSFSIKSNDASPKFSTLVELVQFRTSHYPIQTAFTFLLDGEHEKVYLTYEVLDKKARAIAARLQQVCSVGERALILYPPGLDYIATFLGCLYAGVVAVPAYPPRNARNFPRIAAIARDAQAPVILTSEISRAKTQSLWEQMDSPKIMHWLGTDSVSLALADHWQKPELHPYTLAMLQYTSGSTALPKGVRLTHGNLLHNLSLISTSFQTHPQSQGVIWLPPYHDMGLIGGILQPIYAGFPVTLMSPVSFLQRPLRWLQAISQAKATISGGPNFAYELCIRKTTPKQRLELDLTSWDVAFNGAESIQAETLDRFAAAFAPSGFRREAFYPCYGLAEATLIVTGGQKTELPIVQSFQKAALTQNQAIAAVADADNQMLVSCGHTLPTQKVVIVDPETLVLCRPGQIGEIWVAGNSVAQGYWDQPEQTTSTFQAHLANQGDVSFLRTGDLGFLQDNELFVTGRLKDLMIIRGRNYYPQDIEWTVDRSHASLQSGCSAAFVVEAMGEERLVIVREIERHDRDPVLLDEIIAAIRRSVVEQHDLEVHGIILVKLGGIPKTSSGKTQHFACRESFLSQSLPVIHQSIQQFSVQGRSTDSDNLPNYAMSIPVSFASGTASQEIQTWLIFKIAEKLAIPANAIDIHQPLAAYGLGSLAAVSLAGELEDWLKCRLSPTVIYDYPTIVALSQALAVDKIGSNPVTTQQPESNSDSIQSVTASADDIAIIGIGCRFPGANNPTEFWQFIQSGRDAIQEVPDERWQAQLAQLASSKISSIQGGFLEQIDGFDSQFFGIAPREADRIDPQHRLLLEVAWEALEAAGQPIAQLSGSETGVFIGISSQDYAQLQSLTDVDAYTVTGNAHNMVANRLSYLLNFQGPSLAVDTACSSSLVAVHLACQSLRSGECDLALAGGVNLLVSPTLSIALSQAGMLSPDGRCKTFDASADGYGRGEGCGVVVLKPLHQAVAAGDSILAVIKGSAVNQDGLSNGLTAPNGLAQQRVIQKALQKAGVKPERISYVEAHGTGTSLGDPIEIGALKAVLLEGRSPEQTCAIGSVKTNIGHLEAAAGIAGLIKTVLALQHRQLPPHLHLETLNPKISLAATPFLIPAHLTDWTGDRCLAGVSSFGFGGTNAHVIVAEAPPSDIAAEQAPSAQSTMPFAQLLPLSARSPVALQAVAQRYCSFLRSESAKNLPLSDICYTASVRRSHHPYRLAVVGHSHAELVEHLEAWLQDASSIEESGHFSGQTHALSRPVFVFSGQGPQWWAMGRELLEREPVFQAALQQCDAVFYDYAGWSLLQELTVDEAASRLQETAIAQPVLFALQVALAALWQFWGVVPDAVVGHSLGEVAAAYIAGALSLPDAVLVIFHRSRLLQRLTGKGKMATVDLPVASAEALLQDYPKLSIAAVNRPTATVVSGDAAAVESIVQTLEQQGVNGHFLPVHYAFHSWQVEPLQEELVYSLQSIQPRPAHLPLFSTVTGQRIDGQALDADYWSRNLRSPVLFQAAITQLIQTEHSLFIEIGPHPVLRTAVAECFHQQQHTGTILPSLRRGQPERAALLQSLAALYRQGYAVEWNHVYPQGRCVSLPTYAWQRQRHWFSPQGKSLSPAIKLRPAEQSQVPENQPLQPESLPTAHLTQSRLLSMPVGERLGILESYFQQRVSHVLGMADSLPIHAPLCNLGLDSLMVVELKHGIEADLNLSLSMTEFLRCPSVAQLASQVLAQLTPSVSELNTVAGLNISWEEGVL